MMIVFFRVFLWRIGLLGDDCPYCGSELLGRYTSYDDGDYEFICPKKRCLFNG